MINSKDLFNQLVNKINIKETPDEIKGIVYLYLEHEFGLSRTNILAGKEVKDVDVSKTEDFIQRINNNEPVQYILGEAAFYGRMLNVTPAVLIPRPETELLIKHISDLSLKSPSILDIGTGSGCIAITLSLEILHAKVYALDVSKEALSIARQNATLLNAPVDFVLCDILHQTPALNDLDLIVSNPPYIMQKEKSSIHANVLGHEPHLALFVPDNDPLLFYRTIAERGTSLLKQGGKIIVEINSQLGKETASAFEESGYRNVSILKDIDQKDRMVMAEFIN